MIAMVKKGFLRVLFFGLNLFLAWLFIAVLVNLGMAEASHAPYQGFGATTPGGSGGTVVHVTNLNDSGPGSLREAVSQGGRIVVFDVAGEIVLSDHVYVTGAFITIDGLTAPSPGITLKNRALVIRGNVGAHDIIVRSIRVRDSSADGIQIAYGASNVVIDHVSVTGSFDENLEVTGGSHDVTISWSILAGNGKNMLIKYDPSRVTVHHNIFTESTTRNPQVRIDDFGTPATDTTVDVRNNLIWKWGNGYGTFVWYGPWANIVNNVYSSPGSLAIDQKEAVVVCQAGSTEGGCQDPLSFAQAYVDGNFSMDGLGMTINNQGNASIPFPAPPVDTEDPCAGANTVLSEAGARPLDLIDQQYLSGISLSSCVGDLGDLFVGSLSAPGSAKAGSTISVTDSTQNGGPALTASSTTELYFSSNNTYDPGDALLASRMVPPLDPGEASSASTSVTIPAATKAGTYYIIAVADAKNILTESNEGNNSKAKAIKIGPAKR